MRTRLDRLASLIFFSVFQVTREDLVNITIDDQHGDALSGLVPTYAPVGNWTQGSTCNGCKATPNPAFAFEGTWHDATHHPGAPGPLVVTISFTGVAVYVYCIVPDTIDNEPTITTLANMTFLIDENQVGTYIHIPTTDDDYIYDVPVYTNTLLELRRRLHTITATSTGGINPFMAERDSSSGSMGTVIHRDPTLTARSDAATVDELSAIPESTSFDDTYSSSAPTTLAPSASSSRTSERSSPGFSRRSRVKAASHRAALARQVQGTQQNIADLQARQHRATRQLPRTPNSSAFRSVIDSTVTASRRERRTSTLGASASTIGSNEEILRSQIAILRAQVDLLRMQQQELRRLEMIDEAPPEYMEDPEG